METKPTTIFAIDTGNHSIKTPNCIFRASLVPDDGDIEGERLVLPNGEGYSIGMEDINHNDSKANDEYLKLVMIGMAKELIFRTKKKRQDLPKSYTRDNAVLSMGLPPRHMKKFEKEYKEFFKRKYEFYYADIKFEIDVKEVMVFAQCLSAASVYLDDILSKANDIYLIDIGGFTTDVIRFFGGKLSKDCIITDNFGVLPYYKRLQNTIVDEKGWRMQNENFDAYFLRATEAIQKKEKLRDIYEKTRVKYVTDMLSRLHDQGVRIESALPVFFGGGSRIFKPAIEEYFAAHDTYHDPVFITDVKANAVGFYEFARNALEERKAG